MTSWLVRGRPRQFMLMCAKRRCSILFHLLVPGGKWHTVTDSPVSDGTDPTIRQKKARQGKNLLSSSKIGKNFKKYLRHRHLSGANDGNRQGLGGLHFSRSRYIKKSHWEKN